MNRAAGNDTMDGGAGDDELHGDQADVLSGGKGEDRFIISSTSSLQGPRKFVTIKDYEDGEDTIKINSPLSFDLLVLEQESEDTVIYDAAGGKWAVLEGIDERTLDDTDFEFIMG